MLSEVLLSHQEDNQPVASEPADGGPETLGQELFDPFAMVAAQTGQETVVTVLVEDPTAIQTTVSVMHEDSNESPPVIVEVAPRQVSHESLDAADKFYRDLKRSTRGKVRTLALSGLLLANPLTHMFMHPHHLFEGAHGLGHLPAGLAGVSGLDPHHHDSDSNTLSLSSTTHNQARGQTSKPGSTRGAGVDTSPLEPIFHVISGFAGLENVIGGIFDLFPTNSWQQAA